MWAPHFRNSTKRVILNLCVRHVHTSFSAKRQLLIRNGYRIFPNTFFDCQRTITSCQSNDKKLPQDTSNTSLLSLKPHEFVNFLRSHNISRCYAVWNEDNQRVEVSHPVLEPIANWLNDSRNTSYRKHEAIFLQIGARTGNLLGAFIWKTDRGEACGGIRMTSISSMMSFLTDGLRLSLRLGRKAALAGLWIGGGKGLIPEPPDKQHILPDYRQKLFWDYGDFITSLNGCYIAGSDIGVNSHDMVNVHLRSRWSVCLAEDIGGCGNAFELLGRAVVCAMEAGLCHLEMGDIKGKTVAVQGAGGIGIQVVAGLLKRDVGHVYVTDTNQKRVDDCMDMLHGKAGGRLTVNKVPIGDHSILKMPCDILSPCAVGHVFRANCIHEIQAKLICGPANAQLPLEEDCKAMEQKGILFIPEALPNRMALVCSAYESLGRVPVDPLYEMHFDRSWPHSVYVLTTRILKTAAEKGITTIEASHALAEELAALPHPLWPRRVKTIIQGLIQTNWHQGYDFWRSRHNYGSSTGCA